MSDAIVAVCPSCAQKYRVRPENIGMRALCKQCGQPFKLLEEPPIDDETIFGWVTEDDPSNNSVLGGTGIFRQSFHESTQVTATNRWTHPPPPDEPRVTLDNLSEEGACFGFNSVDLRDAALRSSLPHKCAQCLGREDLEVHFVIWPEKVPSRDAAMINEAETRSHRKLDKLMSEHGLDWFDALESINTLPPPYNEPFPYCVCPQCSVIGAVWGRVVADAETERCQLIVVHPTVALEFYRNNGGRNTPAYKRLLVASRQRRDNQWKALAVGVRIKLGQWYKPRGDEKFMGYFSDRDFDKADRGTAGIVLTNKRIVYKKYAALREYPLDTEGVLDIEASRSMANLEIIQPGNRNGLLSTTPLAASSLARTLTSLQKPWKINVTTHR